MRRHLCAAITLAVVGASLSLHAQWSNSPTIGAPRTRDGKVNMTGPVPKVNGKPDLSGIWQSTRSRFNIAAGLKTGETVPFQPWAKEVFDERQANNSKDDPGARCLPV